MLVYSSSVEPFEPRARPLMDVHPQDDGTDDDNLASSVLSSEPKLTSKSNSSPVNPDELWAIREVPNGIEELYSRGKCVYWTRNSLIVKSFNFTEQVVKVFWTQFGKRDHICMAFANGLSIFNTTGQHFQIPLPFSCRGMYPSNVGILIERNCDPLDDPSLPSLFTLTEPTQEIAPVIFRDGRLSYSLPSYISVASCHDTLPLCLMYNSKDNNFSIWKMRRTNEEEFEEFQRYSHDESSMTTFANHHSSYNQSSTFNLSSKHRTSAMNYSPKVDSRSRHSTLGNLAASRLGVGGANQMTPDANVTNTRSFSSIQTMMSTPNRNRVVNYLRDNIEEPILPELTFELGWESDYNTCSSKPSKIFSITDLVGKKSLVVVFPGCDQGVRLIEYASGIFGETVCSLERTDASPVPSMNLMITYGQDKMFYLHSGVNSVAQLCIPQPLEASQSRLYSSPSPTPSKNRSIVFVGFQMSSARKRISMGEQSSGEDTSFQQMFQTLSPVPHAKKPKTSTPINSTHLKKIECVTGRTVYVMNQNNQRAKFVIPTICQATCIRKILDSMKSIVNEMIAIPIIGKWYEYRRSPSRPEFMHIRDEMRLFKNWILDCLGVCSNYFDDSKQDKVLSPITLPYTKKERKSKDTTRVTMILYTHTLFYGIHLAFEEFLLNKLNYENACDLAELLMVLACILKLNEYQEYYWLKFPHLQEKYGKFKEEFENLAIPALSRMPRYFQAHPPSVIDFLNMIVARSKEDKYPNEDTLLPFPYIPGVSKETSNIISLFSEMFNIDRNKSLIAITPTSKESSPHNALEKRPHRSKSADEKVVLLMVNMGKNRNYLSSLPEGINLYLWDAILNCRESPPSNWSEACYNLIGRMDLVNLIRGRARTGQSNDEDEVLKLIFPDDIRVSEAHRMLASDVPVEFSVTQRQGATEEESRDEIHRHLYLLNVRTMAMPVGRGAISLRTYCPVIGESFEVPRLELSGRAMSEDRPIEYTHDTSVYPWPFFHNGVAAGLTICASTVNNIIDSTWINYNHPRSNIPHGADMRDRDLTAANINNEHAGFLFALGLNGHLEKLSLMALHDYLCQNNDLTKLAILLGMSAAKRGSRDNNIIKVLSIHVDALLPPNSTELDVPAPVHAASIIGVGLLYQSSGDSHISKVLLEEIGRLPGPEANSHVDRESYSLSAGLAFGLVNLCKGGSSTISSSDQLRLYMLGGKRKPLTMAQKERYFKQDCHRGEEEYINTHITSAGGTLGLGLMYHRSGNQSVANWMRAPDTQTLLENVRPDFLILRMLSYGLIMWDEIEASEDWINSHIPSIVSLHAFQRNSSPNSSRLIASASFNCTTDYELISQAYCNIVAGCCMAIAMRFAGTSDKNAYNTIYKHTKMLIALNNKPALAEQAGRPCIEACLNVLVTSLAVVMAGTGNLGVMRFCRYLRSRLTQSCVFYGSYMALHMSLGLLFLGSCRYSLSSSPESIGALVCALYPIYPNHSSDNRYHLQALRHLYVLAAEPRLLIPRDIQANKPVYVWITVRQKNHGDEIVQLKLKAPCLMPEVESIESVCVDDDRYWRIEINSKEALMRCLFQDQGYLSVKQKAHPSNNQLVKDIDFYILQNMSQGVMKSRKSAALTECVKEDRVEQYSALNELLTKSSSTKAEFRSMKLEQLRLASSLADSKLMDKIHLLDPVIGEFDDELSPDNVHEKWCNYITKATDWTDTSESVARYINLYDLKCDQIDDELLNSIRDINLRVK